MEGFIARMEDEPGMKVVFVESGYSNLQMSERKIRRIRAAHPLIEGIAATSAVTALGIAEGLRKTAGPFGEILDAGVLTAENVGDYMEREYQE